jgi:hypothetical protein
MNTNKFELKVGSVEVAATENCGHTPEYWASRVTAQIVSISKTAAQPIRSQAEAFAGEVEHVICNFMKQAILSDRATLAGLLEKQGHGDMAEIIRRL